MTGIATGRYSDRPVAVGAVTGLEEPNEPGFAMRDLSEFAVAYFFVATGDAAPASEQLGS